MAECAVGVAHGWIIDYLASRTPGVPVSTGLRPPLFGWVGSVGSWWLGWVVSGTLLGPEGSDAGSAFLWASLLSCTGGLPFLLGWFFGGGLVVGCRPYFENYTVDASIFVSIICRPKFLRAHGGCLGTRNRRRT
jgi:hypothetical protein